MAQLLHASLGKLTNRLPAAIDAGEDLLQCCPTLLNDPAQDGQTDDGILLFLLLVNDLSESDGGEVLPRIVVDDPQLFAGADHVSDAVEGDIPAGSSIVHLSVCVPLDQPRHRPPSCLSPPNTANVARGKRNRASSCIALTSRVCADSLQHGG